MYGPSRQHQARLGSYSGPSSAQTNAGMAMRKQVRPPWRDGLEGGGGGPKIGA